MPRYKRKQRNALSTERSRAPSPAAAGGPPAWAAAFVLAIAIAAVYGPALNVPFIYDDDVAIVSNKSIESLWPLYGTEANRGPLNPEVDRPTCGRPLVNLTFAINRYFGGLNPVGYHVVNVVIHIASTLLLWAIVRRTLRVPYFDGKFATSSGWLALAIALLWALHPLLTEAVIYTTQRTELMMGFLYLATLYCSLRYWKTFPPAPIDDPRSPLPATSGTQRGLAWLGLAIVCCLAGMASKQVMASAPIIVLLFDWTFVSRSMGGALRRSWPLYAGLAATWVLLFVLAVRNPYIRTAGFGHGVAASTWWLTQTKVLWMYFTLAIWPAPLQIHYQLPYLNTLAESWAYVAFALLLVTAVLVLLLRKHPAGFLGAFALAILTPTFVVPLPTEIAAERRMYLPLAALVVFVVMGAYLLAGRIVQLRQPNQRAALGSTRSATACGWLVCLLAIALGLVSTRRLAAYHDEFALWQDVIRLQPQNFVAHENLGFYLDKAGKTAEAIEHYRAAIRLDPMSPQTHYSLATILLRSGAAQEAVPEFREVLKAMPKDAQVQNNVAVALYLSGQYGEAITAYGDVLKSDPSNWQAHNNLGMAFQKSGKYQQSIASFRRALELNPNALDTYNDLANSYVLSNQREKVIATVTEALDRARAVGDNVRTKQLSDWLEANR